MQLKGSTNITEQTRLQNVKTLKRLPGLQKRLATILLCDFKTTDGKQATMIAKSPQKASAKGNTIKKRLSRTYHKIDSSNPKNKSKLFGSTTFAEWYNSMFAFVFNRRNYKNNTQQIISIKFNSSDYAIQNNLIKSAFKTAKTNPVNNITSDTLEDFLLDILRNPEDRDEIFTALERQYLTEKKDLPFSDEDWEVGEDSDIDIDEDWEVGEDSDIEQEDEELPKRLKKIKTDTKHAPSSKNIAPPNTKNKELQQKGKHLLSHSQEQSQDEALINLQNKKQKLTSDQPIKQEKLPTITKKKAGQKEMKQILSDSCHRNTLNSSSESGRVLRSKTTKQQLEQSLNLQQPQALNQPIKQEDPEPPLFNPLHFMSLYQQQPIPQFLPQLYLNPQALNQPIKEEVLTLQQSIPQLYLNLQQPQALNQPKKETFTMQQSQYFNPFQLSPQFYLNPQALNQPIKQEDPEPPTTWQAQYNPQSQSKNQRGF